VYGTTQTPFPLLAGGVYRISLWARGEGLASEAAVAIIVDQTWKDWPIQLPAGSFEWRRFEGVFTAHDENTQIRIISRDRGEVWLDDFYVDLIDDSNIRAPEFDGVLHLPDEPGEQQDVERQPQRASTTANSESARIGAAVADFRRLALQDYKTALERYAAPHLWRSFLFWNEHLWLPTKPNVGWSYFLSTAVVAPVGEDSENMLVAFYNPWCDVFLVTRWVRTSVGTQMRDAEMMRGDVLRDPQASEFNPTPLWLRKTEFKPAALAASVSESIHAFQNTLASVRPEQWRRQYPTLADHHALVHVNYAGVSSRLADALGEVRELRFSQDDGSQLNELRKASARALQMASSGKMQALLAEADQTLSVMQKILTDTDAKEFRHFTPVHTVVGDNRGVIFLTPLYNADFCMSLLVESLDEAARISRIDLVFYDAAYRTWRNEHESD
jgi:hypothetical protein